MTQLSILSRQTHAEPCISLFVALRCELRARECFSRRLVPSQRASYHASGLGRGLVGYSLHVEAQAESGEHALNAFKEGDAEGSESDTEARAWRQG
jgi:hypothetical protein